MSQHFDVLFPFKNIQLLPFFLWFAATAMGLYVNACTQRGLKKSTRCLPLSLSIYSLEAGSLPQHHGLCFLSCSGSWQSQEILLLLPTLEPGFQVYRNAQLAFWVLGSKFQSS